MPDYLYEFTSFPFDPPVHAARLAVLHPLAGPDTNLPPGEVGRPSIKAGRVLLKEWRDRTTALRDAGLQRLAKSNDLQYARNCWPGGMLGLDLDRQSRACRLTDVCPWCAARRATEVFGEVQWALLKVDDEVDAGEDGGCRLVTLIALHVHPIGVNLRETLQSAAHGLRVIARAYSALGAYLAVATSPEWRRAPRPSTACEAESRLLLLLPEPTRLSLVPPGWRVHQGALVGPFRLTPSRIQDHVARVCRYPVGLMRDDPSRVVELLHARRDLRLSECLGSFRSQSAAADVDSAMVVA